MSEWIECTNYKACEMYTKGHDVQWWRSVSKEWWDQSNDSYPKELKYRYKSKDLDPKRYLGKWLNTGEYIDITSGYCIENSKYALWSWPEDLTADEIDEKIENEGWKIADNWRDL